MQWCFDKAYGLCKFRTSPQEAPEVYKSAQVIYVLRPQALNKKDELIMNFRLSVRGAIRQAPSVIAWHSKH